MPRCQRVTAPQNSRSTATVSCMHSTCGLWPQPGQTRRPAPARSQSSFGTTTQRDTPWARPGNLVSNGPFTLKAWHINHFIEVKKNPNYWDAARVKLNEIHFFLIDNYESEERVFLDGQLHVTPTDLPFTDMLRQSDGGDAIIAPSERLLSAAIA